MKNQFTYFNNCNNLQDVKTIFRQLAKKYHPDLGGNTEIFKIINNEYELAFEYFKNLDNKKEEQTAKQENRKAKYNYESSIIYKNIIEKLIHYDKINIELIGSWLWITGNTYPLLDLFHELNFKWSKSKKAWYYFEGIENDNGYYKSRYNLNQLKDKHGCIKIDNDPSPKLQ